MPGSAASGYWLMLVWYGAMESSSLASVGVGASSPRESGCGLRLPGVRAPVGHLLRGCRDRIAPARCRVAGRNDGRALRRELVGVPARVALRRRFENGVEPGADVLVALPVEHGIGVLRLDRGAHDAELVELLELRVGGDDVPRADVADEH